MPSPRQPSLGHFVDLLPVADDRLSMTATAEGLSEWEDIEAIRDQLGIDAAVLALLEDHFGNEWEHIQPEEVGALTSALLISDRAERSDDGSLLSCEVVYFNPQYQVMDEIEQLRTGAAVVLHACHG